MMTKAQSNTTQAIWIGMGSISTFALAIISAAILSRYLSKIEYGTYRQILYIYSSLLVIFTAGLPKVFSYFLPRYTKSKGKDIVWRVTRVLFLLGLIFSTFLFLLSDFIADVLNNPELKVGLKYFSPIPMFLLPTLGIEGIFSTYKQTIHIAIYNTISRFMMLLFIVLPVVIFDGSYLDAIKGWLIVSIITLFIAFYFKSIPFKGINKESSDLSYKEILKYSFPLVLASLAGMAIKAADQFYISKYFGPEVFAEFANGFIELPFVGMVTGATSMILMPIFSKLIHDKSSTQNIISLWRNALLKSVYIIYPMVLFFISHAKEVVSILYSASYKDSAIYFQIAMVLNFFNIILFAPLLLAMGKTKFYFTLHAILAIATWCLGYIIIGVFNSPIAIAILSVSLAIIKVIIFMKYIANIFEIALLDLVPIRMIVSVVMHSLLLLWIINLLINYAELDLSVVIKLLLEAILYSILLIGTGKAFRIDYLNVVRPVLGKYIKI
ncbi:oligosaccharide flippase family protein [Pontibacter sp. H249]|uniref:oligosaccharide flippase family protein n=1 Tax=Pontibacter sp. H249 TaxID=3133420 RepID=UPI0030BCB04B